jgi:hypothetical protein
MAEYRIRFDVIIEILMKHGIFKDDSFRNRIMELRIEELRKIRDNLEDKTSSQKNKPPFHLSTFFRFRQFIFRMFRGGR